jgi:predicted nucleotidyltransferase
MPKLELSHLQFPEKHLPLMMEILHAQIPHMQVWAYGSRVSGGWQECSDLDMVLRNSRDLSTPCKEIMELKEAFQSSLIPILIDVHDWAHLPAEFHRNIEREHVELQAGDG